MCVCQCPVSDLSLCPLSATHVSSDTFPLPFTSSVCVCGECVYGCEHGRGAPSHSKGPPAQHVKTLSTSTLIHGDPVSASLGLCRAVISHQADQRTTAGSERTLTRRSPSGWQAIAHPLLTCRHALHLTAVSGAGLCLLQV